MKIRTSFVANSSSSSFVVSKSVLTPEQIEKIKNYYAIAKELNNSITAWIEKYKGPDTFVSEDTPWFGYLCDSWRITETDDKIEGFCVINNFNFHSYLDFIGVDTRKVTFKED